MFTFSLCFIITFKWVNSIHHPLFLSYPPFHYIESFLSSLSLHRKFSHVKLRTWNKCWKKPDHDESSCKDSEQSEATKIMLRNSMKGQFTTKYLIFREIWKNSPCCPNFLCVVPKSPVFSQSVNSIFPCTVATLLVKWFQRILFCIKTYLDFLRILLCNQFVTAVLKWEVSFLPIFRANLTLLFLTVQRECADCYPFTAISSSMYHVGQLVNHISTNAIK